MPYLSLSSRVSHYQLGKVIEYRNLRDINRETFEKDLLQLQLPAKLNECSSVDDMVVIFESNLLNLIDRHAPIITRVVIERPNTAWYTPELSSSKCYKRQLERRWLKSGLAVHRIQYRQQCAAYNKLLTKTYILHVQSKMSEYEKDSAKLHKYCKSILCLPKSKIMIDGCSTEQESANALASFFKTKVSRISNELENEEKLSSHPTSSFVSQLEEKCVSSEIRLSDFEPASETDVKKLITTSNNKSCDLDVIPPRVFKCFPNSFAPSLTIIINKSLETGTVPCSYKKAIVIPSLKKPSLDSSDLSSYRPVSNLVYVSKLIEKVVSKQLITHLNNHDLLPSTQSAYRKNYSTETSLLHLTNHILCNLDKGRCTLLVTLDISAAFDTVDHQRLLRRYSKSYGLSDTVLLWMQSYLSGRSQLVQVGSALSELQQIESGFPQGATLAGIKYNMFSSPMHEISQEHGVDHDAYADDSNLSVSFDIYDQAGTDNAVNKLENCLSDIQSWMLINRLKLNSGKTYAILFYPPCQANIVASRNISIKMNGKQLEMKKNK